MSNPLTPLLEILKNPDHPNFARALEQLDGIKAGALAREDLPALLAQLEQTITILAQGKSETAKRLEDLRNQAQALRSYGAHK